MSKEVQVAIPVSLFVVYCVWITGSTGAGLLLPNLSQACYDCLCYAATECDLSHECTAGYCGPYNISRVYWVDSGRVIMPEDELSRHRAWVDCAVEINCAKRIIEGYLQRFAQDCNGDGVTNCMDYLMIHGNGGYTCDRPLDRFEEGRILLHRYQQYCKF